MTRTCLSQQNISKHRDGYESKNLLMPRKTKLNLT